MIPDGGILGFAFYFVLKDGTAEKVGSRESRTSAVQYSFQWHSVFFLSS